MNHKTTIVIEIEQVIDSSQKGDASSRSLQDQTAQINRTVTINGRPYYSDSMPTIMKQADKTPISLLYDWTNGIEKHDNQERKISVNIEKIYENIVVVNTDEKPFDIKDFARKINDALNLTLSNASYIPE